MKEFKNLMIIGVDHGYGNIKTAGTVTKNGVTAYEHPAGRQGGRGV